MNEKRVTEHKDFADKFLKLFVHGPAELYGKHLVSYNVYCLTYLRDVAEKYGCLENC